MSNVCDNQPAMVKSLAIQPRMLEITPNNSRYSVLSGGRLA